MIETHNLTRRYRHNDALTNVSFKVPRGSVFALTGANGAGKSTAIIIFMNLLQPTSGRAEILGIDSTRLGPQQRARIGYFSEDQDLPEWMKVDYLLNHYRAFYPDWDNALASELIHRFALPLDQRLRILSRGMKVKAALTASLAYRPELIVLDEPFSGLDLLVREQLIETLVDCTPEATVLLASHDLAEIESFATHVANLNAGNLEFVEEMAALSSRFREVEIILTDQTIPTNLPSRPRLAIARTLVVTGFFAAACVYLALPASASYTLRSSTPVPPTIQLRPPAPDDTLPMVPGIHSIVIPLSIHGDASIGGSSVLQLELITSNGVRMKAKNPSPNRPGEVIDLFSYMSGGSNLARRSLVLRFSNSAWRRMLDLTLSLHASVGITFTKQGETTRLQIYESTEASQVGRCRISNRGNQFQDELLKVFCESPETVPNAWLVLRTPASTREWRLPLNQAFTNAAGPRDTWLTPLQRAQTFFRLTDQPETAPGNSWQVPRSYLAPYRLEITPDIVTGHALAEFNLVNINLSSFAR